MSVPSLPTDNLYKLMAITGLAIFLLSWYGMIQSLDSGELLVKFIELENELNKVDREVNVIKQRSATIDSANIGSISELPITEQYFYFIERSEISKKLDSISDLSVKLKMKRQRIETDMDNLYFLKDLIDLGIYIGLSLMIFGFYNWYFRWQVYQDALIKQQAVKEHPELEPKEYGVQKIIGSFLYVPIMALFIWYHIDDQKWKIIIGLIVGGLAILQAIAIIVSKHQETKSNKI